MRTKLIKIFFVSFLVSGGIYAVLGNLSENSGEEFSLMRFLSYWIPFGISMELFNVVLMYFQLRKEKKNE